jgi:recombination protein RecT
MTTKQRNGNGGNANAEPKPSGQEIRPITEWEKRRNHLRGLLTTKGFLGLLESAIPRAVQLDPRSLAWQAIVIIETPNDKGEQPLMACSDASICRAVLKAATAGLQFQGEAYLIPYGEECTFMASVWGELHVVQRSGKLKRVWTDVIYEADDFRIVRGLNPDLIHEITESFGLPGANYPIGDGPKVPLSEKGRGAVLCAYACAELEDGAVQWSIMLESEMALARSTSKSANSPAHKNWGDEMRKKMALRRAMKSWPKAPDSIDMAELERADTLNDDQERGLRTVIDTTGEPSAKVLEPPRPSMGDDLAEQLRKSTEANETAKVPVHAAQPPVEANRGREPGDD